MTKVYRGAWLVWGLAATFYAYGFFQRVAPSVMVDDLMRDFALGGAMLGSLSAAYFYAYAAVQIPIGMLLDRLGPRRMVTGAVLVAAIGALIFGIAWTFTGAVVGRALVGASVGASYIGALKLASLWFPPSMFGLMAGLTLAAGMVGAIGAQAPLAAAVQAFGWRTTAIAAALAAFLLALLCALWIRDRPPDRPAPTDEGGRAAGMLAGLIRLLRRRDIWLLVAYTSTVGAPVLTFAGLWGVPYLMQAQGLSRAAAGASTSVMLAAWAVGGPFAGWLSDRIGRRKAPMVTGAAIMLLCWLALVLWPDPPLAFVLGLFVVIGLAGGLMVVAFAYARDVCGLATAGVAMGIVNSGVLFMGAAGQTLIGVLLDLQWTGAMAAGARLYDADAYRRAFVTLVASSVVTIAAGLALPETWCRTQDQPAAAA